MTAKPVIQLAFQRGPSRMGTAPHSRRATNPHGAHRRDGCAKRQAIGSIRISGRVLHPRIYWTSRPDTLAMIVLTRKQNEMKLLFFDVNTGGSRQVMDERSDTWIDVYDFYAGVQDLMTFPENSHEFFWVSDRDGFQHVYRYDYSGKLVQQVTRGPWSVTRIEGTDAAKQTIYFTSTNPSPLERQLWKVKFDGTGLTRITTSGKCPLRVANALRVLHRHVVVSRAAASRSSCVRGEREAAHHAGQRGDDAVAGDRTRIHRPRRSPSRRATA